MSGPSTPVASNRIAGPKNASTGNSSSVFPPSIMCAGASRWVPVCECIWIRVSTWPSTARSLTRSKRGGSVPG